MFYTSARPKEEQCLDIVEALPQLTKSKEFNGRERWLYIVDLLGRTTGELKYVEHCIRRIFESDSYMDYSDGYRDTSLILEGVEGYGLRINRWVPLGTRRIDTKADLALSYDLPHNHDFQLVTKGILGPGYQTDVYRMDPQTAIGAYGEHIPLTYQGRFQLSLGSVIWFEEFRDVHTQIAPDVLSISFNVIPTDRVVQHGQLFFDLNTNCVTGFAETSHARILGLFTLLSDLAPTEDTKNLIFEVGSLTKNTWFRLALGCLAERSLGAERLEAFERLEVSERYASMRNIESYAMSSVYNR